MPPIHPPSSPLHLFHQTITSAKPQHIQIRHATFIARPRRPYTFAQLVTLSDGSTYVHRTSSPAPVYKSTKDTRNTQLWNPSSQRLANIESDDAGRLRAFRSRFGRGWDSKRGAEIEVDGEGVEVEEVPEGQREVEIEAKDKEEKRDEEVDDGGEESLMDLISSPEFDSGIALGPKEKKKRKKYNK